VVEAKARFAPAAERLVRRAETAPLLASFFDWAGKVVAKLSAKSELAEAFRYTIKRREALSRFLTDARLEIDNNIAENAMRCIALGRNYPYPRVMCSSPRWYPVRRSAGLHVCH
jgi:transposase